MISQRIKNLIKKAEQEKTAQEFWKEIEAAASEMEITVEYYLAEFY
jgi:hypothetical protein